MNVQMVTNGKEIDPKKCPLKRLYALASSEHVNASTMIYSTLDLWSEGEPVFDNFEGRPSHSNGLAHSWNCVCCTSSCAC